MRLRRVARRVITEVEAGLAWLTHADLAVFHRLEPSPTGGGNQFVRALVAELRARGLRVEQNRISSKTPVCLYNSFNFDFDRLRRFYGGGVRMVHRVDGPVSVYRGADDGTDRRVAEINREFADATIFQSAYSLEATRALGLELREPTVIHNAVDASIFHPAAPRVRGRRTRLVATSWSQNPNKGFALYTWLDDNLDFDRYEVTFVGRSPVAFRNIRMLPPLLSRGVADVLRAHDAFVFASLHESCSNALLEALACGLPALFVESGSNGELVGDGGVGFRGEEDVLPALDRLAAELEDRRAAIVVESLADVTSRYLAVLGVRRLA